MKKLIYIALSIAFSIGMQIPAYGQNTAMSPYTRYGYGNLSDNATSMQRGMGGVGYAMRSGRQINVMNPASYAAMDSLTFLFDMGVDFSAMWQSENGAHDHNYGGGLDYITMQVPIMRGLGASVGILPYGSVGYSFGNSIENGNVAREGDGSINLLYLGVGGSPVRGLALGLNFGYLFGSTSNSLYATTTAGSVSMFQRTMSVRDWYLDFGAMYTIRAGRGDLINLGVVYAPRKNLHGSVYGIYYDATSSPVVPDTVNLGDTKMNGRYSLPEKWGAGINWQHGARLQTEIDFTYQPWSKAKFGSLQNFEDTKFADRYRVGIGASYTPNFRGGYFKRMQYRVGAFYNRDYIIVRDNNVRDYGVSLGLGLPVPGFKSVVNLGFEYRHRQAYPMALLKENYFNITLGINFNEMWFRKSVIY